MQPTTIHAFTVVQSLSWDVGSGLNQAIKNRPKRAAINAVAIPITRPYHYICSDVTSLVQPYVTSSVVRI
ncbi:MAG: hypothetical protein CM15mP39_10480 [Synechococcus sp.]|nr:MAG: hypothetical protein CM15mP39_10480 [Synechococcus sp.]